MSNGDQVVSSAGSLEPAGLIGIYTLTPTHCGSGQAAGAVDLPIIREAHTRFPILPATAIKGVARQFVERRAPAQADTLFGPRLQARGEEEAGAGPGAEEKRLFAGALTIVEGRLLALPVRSLSRSFFYVTCPLILERLDRDLRAFGLGALLPEDWATPDPGQGVLVSDQALAGKALVLEDLVFSGAEVRKGPNLRAIAAWMGGLLPAAEAETARRFANSLAVVCDRELTDLVERTLPVLPRVSLNDKKTTDGEGGNLWYEEVVPSDTLFLSIVQERRQVTQPGSRAPGKGAAPGPLGDLAGHFKGSVCLQIGGNETVGQGQTLWTYRGSK